jgi:hypothetical protein
MPKDSLLNLLVLLQHFDTGSMDLGLLITALSVESSSYLSRESLDRKVPSHDAMVSFPLPPVST